MKKTLSTILIVIAVLALAGGIFFAGSMYTRFHAFGPSMMFGSGRNNNTYGPNMMNSRGGNNMMGGNGGNMMNGYGYNNANLAPLTVDQAKAAAEKYLAKLNNSDLKIAEVMIFDNNAYVVVKETSTGNGAFELLVDPTSQVAYPEYGPNMMWNLKYSGFNHQYTMGGTGGMMGGNSRMMGGNGNMMSGWDNTTPANVSATMTVTPEQAIAYAILWLLHPRLRKGRQGSRNVERQWL